MLTEYNGRLVHVHWITGAREHLEAPRSAWPCTREYLEVVRRQRPEWFVAPQRRAAWWEVD